MSLFTAGIVTVKIASGWEATLKHGDGSATKFWGRSEAEARRKAERSQEADRDE
ncbi:MAG: hypothetical protein ACOCY7_01360 [Halodesulfurarchaeum sp.]